MIQKYHISRTYMGIMRMNKTGHSVFAGHLKIIYINYPKSYLIIKMRMLMHQKGNRSTPTKRKLYKLKVCYPASSFLSSSSQSHSERDRVSECERESEIICHLHAFYELTYRIASEIYVFQLEFRAATRRTKHTRTGEIMEIGSKLRLDVYNILYMILCICLSKHM